MVYSGYSEIETGPEKANTIPFEKIGKYTIIEKLGSGSFGTTYLAKESDDEIVSIKMQYIKGDVESNQKRIEQIMKEIEILRDISKYVSVCSEYAVCYRENFTIYWKNEAAICIVMEYINGENLEYYIDVYELTEREKNMDIISDLIIGLDKLHKIGVTHQDIKESNIMYDIDLGKYRYIDWGLGCLKKYCSQGICRGLCGKRGTLYTRPPEMKQEMKQTFPETIAHDIWSLGIVLLDWYTLKNAIEIKKYYQDKSKHLNIISQEEIDEIIETVNNQYIKQILRLLLRVNWMERLENWKEIMRLINENNFV